MARLLMRRSHLALNKDIRIVFMGTPQFAATVLEELILKDYDVCLIVTNADKPVGRKKILTMSPVKELALNHGIDVYQPNSLRNDEAYETISSYKPDLIITCAYGKLLPPNILAIPKVAPINVHGSLLPKLRGASPIQHSILNGDDETGITIMYMDEGMDTGDIITQSKTSIDINETSEELFYRLSLIGAKLLIDTIPDIIDGTITRVKQNEDEATSCSLITKEDGLIDWNNSASSIHNKIRAFSSWPVSYSSYEGKIVKFYDSYVVDASSLNDIFLDNAQPGTIVKAKKADFYILCGKGILGINKMQLEGGKVLEAKDFAHNYKVGSFFE